jgi:hypothetical protein
MYPVEEHQIMNIIAICKDCGNGTLNGKTNPQFYIIEDTIFCNRCGGFHLDVVSVEFETEEAIEADIAGKSWA